MTSIVLTLNYDCPFYAAACIHIVGHLCLLLYMAIIVYWGRGALRSIIRILNKCHFYINLKGRESIPCREKTPQNDRFIESPLKISLKIRGLGWRV